MDGCLISQVNQITEELDELFNIEAAATMSKHQRYLNEALELVKNSAIDGISWYHAEALAAEFASLRAKQSDLERDLAEARKERDAALKRIEDQRLSSREAIERAERLSNRIADKCRREMHERAEAAAERGEAKEWNPHSWRWIRKHTYKCARCPATIIDRGGEAEGKKEGNCPGYLEPEKSDKAVEAKP